MKMKKRSIWIYLVITLLILLYGFITIKNLTTTAYGKVDSLFGIASKIDDYINPQVFKDTSIYEIRKVLHKKTIKFTLKPSPFVTTKNIDIKTESNEIPVKIYFPSSESNLPIIIYSHGGSWVSGNVDDYDNIARKLSKYTKAIVVSVNYRLAPEDPFPAAINDVYNILQWVYENCKNINGDPSRISVAGDSAGGNISTVVSQMARDKGGPKITSQVLIYPSTNIYELNTNSWEYFGKEFNLTQENFNKFLSLYVPNKEQRKSSYASPLLSDNLKDLPNTLIITAEFDPLRDEGEAYGEKLRKSGVKVIITRYKGVTHGFVSMDSITFKADKALKEISTFLIEQFNNKKEST